VGERVCVCVYGWEYVSSYKGPHTGCTEHQGGGGSARFGTLYVVRTPRTEQSTPTRRQGLHCSAAIPTYARSSGLGCVIQRSMRDRGQKTQSVIDNLRRQVKSLIQRL
jgi:hypothetical protein